MEVIQPQETSQERPVNNVDVETCDRETAVTVQSATEKTQTGEKMIAMQKQPPVGSAEAQVASVRWQEVGKTLFANKERAVLAIARKNEPPPLPAHSSDYDMQKTHPLAQQPQDNSQNIQFVEPGSLRISLDENMNRVFEKVATPHETNQPSQASKPCISAPKRFRLDQNTERVRQETAFDKLAAPANSSGIPAKSAREQQQPPARTTSRWGRPVQRDALTLPPRSVEIVTKDAGQRTTNRTEDEDLKHHKGQYMGQRSNLVFVQYMYWTL